MTTLAALPIPTAVASAFKSNLEYFQKLLFFDEYQNQNNAQNKHEKILSATLDKDAKLTF